jgi:hypothetical protein
MTALSSWLPAAHKDAAVTLPTTLAEPLTPAIQADHLSIYRLEAEILRLPQVDLPVEHAFCSGLYARTMHIPAGTVLTGAVHRDESFFVVRKGILMVTTDDGIARIEPGHMSVTRPNTKRAGVALTDVEVTTFHANPDNETEPQALWDKYTVPAPCVALKASAQPLLEETT